MPVDRPFIQVKAMLIALSEDLTAHAVSVNPPASGNPDGSHRLVGGTINLGKTHRDAIVRGVDEKFSATIHVLNVLGAVEGNFRRDDAIADGGLFLHCGHLAP